ncbi:MAG: hypothetical protein FWE32_00470 [Oscillospiraceae bacterium]|nr:hypothetical protein [Oscillospiraceae bacterium]
MKILVVVLALLLAAGCTGPSQATPLPGETTYVVPEPTVQLPTQAEQALSHLFEFVFVRYDLLRDIEVHIMDARRIMAGVVLYLYDEALAPADLDLQEHFLEHLFEEIIEPLMEFQHLLITDTTIRMSVLDERLAAVAEIEAILYYFRDYIPVVIEAVRQGDEAGVIIFVQQSRGALAALYFNLDYLIERERNDLFEIREIVR